MTYLPDTTIVELLRDFLTIFPCQSLHLPFLFIFQTLKHSSTGGIWHWDHDIKYSTSWLCLYIQRLSLCNKSWSLNSGEEIRQSGGFDIEQFTYLGYIFHASLFSRLPCHLSFLFSLFIFSIAMIFEIKSLMLKIQATMHHSIHSNCWK